MLFDVLPRSSLALCLLLGAHACSKDRVAGTVVRAWPSNRSPPQSRNKLDEPAILAAWRTAAVGKPASAGATPLPDSLPSEDAARIAMEGPTQSAGGSRDGSAVRQETI